MHALLTFRVKMECDLLEFLFSRVVAVARCLIPRSRISNMSFALITCTYRLKISA